MLARALTHAVEASASASCIITSSQSGGEQPMPPACSGTSNRARPACLSLSAKSGANRRAVSNAAPRERASAARSGKSALSCSTQATTGMANPGLSLASLRMLTGFVQPVTKVGRKPVYALCTGPALARHMRRRAVAFAPMCHLLPRICCASTLSRLTFAQARCGAAKRRSRFGQRSLPFCCTWPRTPAACWPSSS